MPMPSFTRGDHIFRALKTGNHCGVSCIYTYEPRAYMYVAGCGEGGRRRPQHITTQHNTTVPSLYFGHRFLTRIIPTRPFANDFWKKCTEIVCLVQCGWIQIALTSPRALWCCGTAGDSFRSATPTATRTLFEGCAIWASRRRRRGGLWRPTTGTRWRRSTLC